MAVTQPQACSRCGLPIDPDVKCGLCGRPLCPHDIRVLDGETLCPQCYEEVTFQYHSKECDLPILERIHEIRRRSGQP